MSYDIFRCLVANCLPHLQHAPGNHHHKHGNKKEAPALENQPSIVQEFLELQQCALLLFLKYPIRSVTYGSEH